MKTWTLLEASRAAGAQETLLEASRAAGAQETLLEASRGPGDLDQTHLPLRPLDVGHVHVVCGGAHVLVLLVGEDVDADQVDLNHGDAETENKNHVHLIILMTF